ncbi:MAG: hypothetical protein KF729_26155 [Sandaracinaceae bacterium]|nr:hypothetical protein [Sandaracinaceae bacterium]
MTFDTQSIDAVIGALGWILGLSLTLSAGSGLAFAMWWALALDAPGLAKLALRAALAWASLLVTTLGIASLGVAIEVSLGYPFGASSGGLSLFAYLAGLRMATAELAVSHGLLRQHAQRTGSGASAAAAAATAGALALAWGCAALMTFVCAVVGLNMILGG